MILVCEGLKTVIIIYFPKTQKFALFIANLSNSATLIAYLLKVTLNLSIELLLSY